jgi:hypothetical protein
MSRLAKRIDIVVCIVTLILCVAACFYPMVQDYYTCKAQGHTGYFCYFLLRAP